MSSHIEKKRFKRPPAEREETSREEFIRNRKLTLLHYLFCYFSWLLNCKIKIFLKTFPLTRKSQNSWSWTETFVFISWEFLVSRLECLQLNSVRRHIDNYQVSANYCFNTIHEGHKKRTYIFLISSFAHNTLREKSEWKENAIKS